MNKTVIKKHNLVYVSMRDQRYSKVYDLDSSLEVFRNRSGLKSIAQFVNIVSDDTGLPSLFYYLDHHGNWMLKTFPDKVI